MGERYDSVRELATVADSRVDAERAPVVVIAGCGAGTTVAQLREYDVDAYGFDSSPTVLETAPSPVRERLLEADLRDEDLVASLREAFGIDEIDVFVTESLLSFLTIEEATTALARIRETDGVGTLVHQVRIDPPVAAQEGEIDVTIMPPAEWQAACDPDGEDVWRDPMERLDLPPDGTDVR
ncbi:class I SAM-dependent methyltransferase [Natrinema longum]|uniref:Class I SAM-dependent methyltransferase n=1 Tax=Natrinema longum TaxID=370324 RepID=A0A8A2U6M4_9EURY|nr:class I SAM-dependent methyltransferase [Natrinema longum]MBZ6494797.1 class I SAM-dependent methyltransferase [Natrinema longum]QSW83895.1 class I SAM-dependent methyltransferase [Natrinema longum]